MKFYKYHGCGNDFLLLDDRNLTFSKELVSKLCHRKFGVGADGVVLLQPSKIADFRMRYYNSDGSEAPLCGNGLRCLTAFICDYIEDYHEFIIETGAGIRRVESLEPGLVKVSLGKPSNISLNQRVEGREIHLVEVGVPHAVVFVEDLQHVPVVKWGKFHRDLHDVNVNFASCQGGSIQIRTYEKGVEDETLACGTGGAAVYCIASKLQKLGNGIPVNFQSGEQVSYSWRSDEIEMRGRVHFVFLGFWE